MPVKVFGNYQEVLDEVQRTSEEEFVQYVKDGKKTITSGSVIIHAQQAAATHLYY